MKRILKSATLLVTVTAIAFFVQSCNSVKPVEKTDLEGYWILKTLNGEDAKSAFAGTLPNVQFNFENSTIHGNGGCNDFTGAYTLNESNEFSAPNLAATMKMCIQANQEPQFFTALSGTNLTISVDKAGLLTFTQDKTVLLQFEKGEAPAPAQNITTDALAGKWSLTSIDGDMATLFKADKPTMELSNDGKVFGNAGCNTYRGTYTLEENTLAFGPLMATKMACPSLEGENLFTSLLASPLQAGFNGDNLTFSKDGKVVLEFAKAE